MPNSPQTPAERFASILLWLSLAVDGHSTWGRIPRGLGLLIRTRIREINQRFARLAARIGAGRYRPRRPAATRHRQAGPHPRRPDPLPQDLGWLVRLMQEAACFGSQLQFLFADPEMAALLAAAPAPMRRPLRSLCRMLGVAPPPILALPAKPPAAAAAPVAPAAPAAPVAPAAAAAAAAAATPEAPAAGRQAAPPLPSPPSPPRPAPPAQACGPPLPA